MEAAIDEYETFMTKVKENKRKSATTTAARLRSFFPHVDEALSSQTPKKCGAYYEALTTRLTRFKRPVAADTHRNMLLEAKTFFAWCISKKWLRANPLELVKGQGRRKHGKPQLRVNEARKWLDTAVEVAEDAMKSPKKRRELEGSVAALCTLLLGTRSLETMVRVVRDLDDDGRLLWIEDTKTAAGKRTLHVPPELRRYLLHLAHGKKPNDLLFGEHDRAFPRLWVKRLCLKAGVPVVGAHSMRGFHATLAVIGGFSVREVANKLGHEEESTTLQSYADAGAVAGEKQRQALRVLSGGKDREGGTETSAYRSQAVFGR
ncbi:MAG: site-specific integrase [Polyangia bacterium]